jgi:putative component of membrane protein insertase Oxa1/YidC/SpoIIIJ protein YidD
MLRLSPACSEYGHDILERNFHLIGKALTRKAPVCVPADLACNE